MAMIRQRRSAEERARESADVSKILSAAGFADIAGVLSAAGELYQAWAEYGPDDELTHQELDRLMRLYDAWLD